MKPVFWNIPMHPKFEKRFDEYRQQFKSKTGKVISKADFARCMFEFWETEYLEHQKVTMKKKNELIEHQSKLGSLIPKVG